MLTDVVLDLISFLVGQTSAVDKLLIDRANAAVGKVKDLAHDLNSSTSVAKHARDEIKTKTRRDIAESNPYSGLDQIPKMLACIVGARAQGTRPELILALWMKEGGARFLPNITLTGISAVTNADDAKAMFIALNFYQSLGLDILTRYQSTGGDNQVHKEGQFAPEHRAILDRANSDLMQLHIAKEDYAKAMRDNLVVTGGTGEQPFSVQAEGFFYPAMLSISHALFEKIRTQPDPLFSEFSLTYPLSDQLTYLLYNNGRGGKKISKGAYAILKATKPRAAAAGMSLQDFLLHTRLINSEWGGPRRNLIRFDYYLKCYVPVFS